MVSPHLGSRTEPYSWCRRGEVDLEIYGTDFWEIVRPEIVRRGPRKVLLAIDATGALDLSETLWVLIDELGAVAAAAGLEIEIPVGTNANDILENVLDDFPERLKLLSDAAALFILDKWAEEESQCQEICAAVVRSIGRHVQSVEFDSGVPGSGQVLNLWRFDKQFFLVGEGGVAEVFSTLREARMALKRFD